MWCILSRQSRKKSKQQQLKKGKEDEAQGKTELARWSPSNYSRSVDQMFSDLTRRLESPFFNPFSNWLVPQRTFEMIAETRRPFTDIIDSGKEYRLRAEVPGIPKENLNISITPHGIRIEGQSSTAQIDEEKEGYVHKERIHSRIQREFAFPDEVDPESAEAIVKDGVLQVTVAKKNTTKSRIHKVPVR